MGQGLFLDVAFPLNVEGTFQYRCPPGLEDRARPGVRVLAPLSRRTLPGIVVGTGTAARVPGVLPVTAIPSGEPLLGADLLKLTAWTADRYLAPLGLALRAVIPPAVLRSGAAVPRPTVRLHAFAVTAPPESGRPPSPRQAAVLDLLGRSGELPAAELLRRAGADHRTLRLLAERGLLRLEERPAGASPPPLPRLPASPPLDGRQRESADVLIRAMTAGFGRVVLRGPAGSGKFETFLDALRRGLPHDRQALVLVPEVSLSPSLAARLEGAFPGQVAVLRGDLSEGERRKRWLRCRSGEARVALGPRSAVFAPLAAPGIILVDDEQDASYKAQETPRYHAREVAVERARLAGIPVVLASAAPSMETVVLRDEPGTVLLSLPPRGSLPPVRLVDLRTERGEAGAALGGRLRFDLRDNLKRGEKSVLLVNRRGVASAAFCAECGFLPRCPACSSPLALLDEEGTMGCRLCGHREPLFTTCPRCGGAVVRPGSPGTRGVEGEVRRLFPGARVVRLDADIAPRRGEAARIMELFASGGADVLVGTMPSARGDHGPRVTLAGVVDADTSLHHPDFRAAERTFQLLTAARGVVAGAGPRSRVVVQTRYPEHDALQAAARGEDDLFYRQEASHRAEASFPPYGHLVLVTVEEPPAGADEDGAMALKASLAASVTAMGASGVPVAGVEVLGPHPVPRVGKGGRRRLQILLKGPSGEVLRRAVNEALGVPGSRRGGPRVTADPDPVDFS